jgi:hypothetical protein
LKGRVSVGVARQHVCLPKYGEDVSGQPWLHKQLKINGITSPIPVVFYVKLRLILDEEIYANSVPVRYGWLAIPLPDSFSIFILTPHRTLCRILLDTGGTQ